MSYWQEIIRTEHGYEVLVVDGHLVYQFTPDQFKQVKRGEHCYLVTIDYENDWPHPLPQYDEWFHKDLAKVAAHEGVELQEMRDWFCSDDVELRTRAWCAVGDYHGYLNLDGYPDEYAEEGEGE